MFKNVIKAHVHVCINIDIYRERGGETHAHKLLQEPLLVEDHLLGHLRYLQWKAERTQHCSIQFRSTKVSGCLNPIVLKGLYMPE